ncbi:gamma-glutamylcyclotransferase [Microvirga thermotolerans]|uniref:Gamma-glutamylcyclotransferase n=1 Tax=Microvirga thermotolerans TaxID=2651334 RepID=A0A5P9JYF2_9HYPH|nr:gamma-glutamylcyclotransferase [Microvirga thermotolerans]
MPLYFAYGSNMDLAAMARRCPASRPVGTGRLMRHRFFVSSDGYASVMRDPRATVWGLLWDLALADVPALDRYESLATGLYAKVVQPVLTEQGPRRALVYVGRSHRPGVPKSGYMESVVEAAEAAGLDRDYLQSLRRWLPAQAQQPPAERAPPKVRPRWDAPEGLPGRPRAPR